MYYHVATKTKFFDANCMHFLPLTLPIGIPYGTLAIFLSSGRQIKPSGYKMRPTEKNWDSESGLTHFTCCFQLLLNKALAVIKYDGSKYFTEERMVITSITMDYLLLHPKLTRFEEIKKSSLGFQRRQAKTEKGTRYSIHYRLRSNPVANLIWTISCTSRFRIVPVALVKHERRCI